MDFFFFWLGIPFKAKINYILGTYNFDEVIISAAISYVRIVRNVSAFRIFKCFSFRLTRRPYPNYCEMSTMRCVTKSPVADILRSGWKKNRSS